jgi:hypothetical protein
MKSDHTFLDRNFIIFKAIKQQTLTDIDRVRLDRNGLKKSSLNVAPEWLKVWASLVCEYLEYEEEMYPEFMKDEYSAEVELEHIKIDAKAQKETQIQNIAITIDKVVHVLESMNLDTPPVIPLSFEERYNRLWVKDGCLRDNVK